MPPTDAIRTAYAHLQASRFADALEAAAPVRHTGPGALLHALALAGSGRAAAAAPLLAAIAVANPANRHPVLDLLPLIPAGDAPGHLHEAITLRPGDAALRTALGTALAESGPMSAAIDAFGQAAAIAPADPAAWSNLGKALAAAARFPEADAAFATAMRLAPADARIAYNAATALLKAGRMQEGWVALRARHALPGRPPALPGPRLTDLVVAGRTILLRHDEGFGDTLQFIRYARPLAERGARVIAAMPPVLARIVATAPGVAAVVPLDGLAHYDAWAPLLDVPALFVDTVQTGFPYLRPVSPAPALSEGRPAGRRVGIVWAGDPQGRVDRLRSLAPEALAPLRARPGIAWVSLQIGQAPPDWMADPMRDVRDFADTAAIVAQLDAVVSVDTAVAHLAGAMGKPVLLLDRYDSCWRWLTGRTDSPWYPTLRIFRQPSPGDWAGALAALTAAL